MRCLNDLIKTAEENVQAMRSCSCDGGRRVSSVALPGVQRGGLRENLQAINDYILFEQSFVTEK